MEPDYKALFDTLTSRYAGMEPEALIHVICPILVPIHTLEKTITKLSKQSHYRASFSVRLTEENRELIVRGRTGKFVPRQYALSSEVWREIAKGRFIDIDYKGGIAHGEVYIGGNRIELEAALVELSANDYLEIDQFGAAAKILSGLVEYSLSRIARESGYSVRRMPEDMAKHLGTYAHYDFEFERDGITKSVEVKSLWGTNTKYARLIHSKTKGYKTSSCKFAAQDIFAVSLFLRTGNIREFAFARSVRKSRKKPYGLPRASNYAEYVHQNPPCEIGDGCWYATIDEVWNLD
jgi:hypothetical protein